MIPEPSFLAAIVALILYLSGRSKLFEAFTWGLVAWLGLTAQFLLMPTPLFWVFAPISILVGPWLYRRQSKNKTEKGS